MQCAGLLLISLMVTVVAFGQTPAEKLLQAFQQLDYVTAQQQATEIVTHWEAYDPATLETAHTVLGVILYTQNDLPAARSHFQQALQINPHTTLDSVYVSPKIIEWFRDIKASYRPETAPLNNARYVLMPDPRPAAALRSAIIPGWGQLYKKQPGRGYTILAATGISLAAWGVSIWQTDEKRKAYLNAGEPAMIARRYDDYNTWYKRRQVVGYITAALWATAVVDALLSEPHVRKMDVTVTPLVGPRYYAAGIRVAY